MASVLGYLWLLKAPFLFRHLKIFTSENSSYRSNVTKIGTQTNKDMKNVFSFHD